MSSHPITSRAAGWGAILALTLTAVLSWPAAGAAATGQDATLELPAVVRGGSTIVMRWDPRGLHADEVEIVLSLDSGRRFTLHVSPELDPRTNRYVWRVPNLAAHGAMLALRSGTRGQEQVWARSQAFTIVADPGQPRTHVALCEGMDGFGWIDPWAVPAWGPPRAQFESAGGREAAEAPPRSLVVERASVRMDEAWMLSHDPEPSATRAGVVPSPDLKRRN